MDRTPATLLHRLRRGGDPAAWERFVRLFTPLLVRWADRLGIRDADADDLLQDVFLTLLRRLPEFEYEPSKSFRAWLWTVLHHAAGAWHKRKARQPQLLDDLDRFGSPDSVADAAEAEYRRQLLVQALRLLESEFTAATWKLFWEVAVAARPGVEVAQEFGTTPNAVYLARSRVLSRLRQELAGLDS